MAPLVLQFLGVFLLNLCITSSRGQYLNPFDQIEEEHEYLRSADVRRHCQPVLSAAAELPYDGSRASRVKRELSFEKGDWRQDAAGHAPLLPFDGAQRSGRSTLEPLSLATFVVTHVDDEERRARAGRAVNVSGVLLLTVSRKSVAPSFGERERRAVVATVSPEFNLSAGSTNLKILFEGLYAERAKGNGHDGDGERLLCMVGTAVLPRRSTDGPDPWDWAAGNSGRSSFQPPLTAVDTILLVLRYPKELTLTTRAVVGEMRSTSASSDAAYFDTVQLMSALTDWNCMYQFRPEEVVASSRAAPASAANDVVSNRAREMYNGSYPCDVLRRFAHGQVSTVLPGWHCHNSTTATGASCRGLGPFEMDREADADALAGAGIMMQDLQCQQQHGYDMAGKAGAAFVSVVLRALPPWEDWRSAYQRSGLSGKTLSAEGVWDASTGPACMVACRGTPAGGDDKACHFRVCLYFPTTISITGRDTMLGRITGVDAIDGVAQPPLLSFQQHMRPPRHWGYYPDDGRPLLTYKYNYTKVDRAGELLRRNESPSYFRKINPISPALRYPRRDGTGDGDDRRSLSALADTLTLRFPAVPSLFIPPEWIENPILHLEIFSIEHLIDRYVPLRSGLPRKGHASERHSLLDVSAELTISDKLIGSSSSSSSVMSLEGVYNQEDGRLYLIGCRNVQPQRSSSSTSRDLELELEDGVDCSLEVKIEYPPTTMYWFIMSTAKVQIASTRKAADPLHFDTVKLKALPIMYPKQKPDDYFRGIANGVLCVVLLSATIAAALSQLRHLNYHADVAPYVSLVMLGVQALGYATPLVAGTEAAEALLARVTFLGSAAATAPSSSLTPSYVFRGDLLFQTIDLTVKILSLVAFVLTLRLGDKVLRSRARMRARSLLDPARVPSDAMVLAYHLGAHLAIFLAILALSRRAVAADEHVGLMQDLFLLPQAIGNVLWRVNCRPLKGSFYAGVTALRLLPHAYDYVRPPTHGSSYYPGVQESVKASGGSFFARGGGDVVIPLAAVALALVVHVQQRWNYAIVGRICRGDQKKLQHVF